MGKYVKRKPKTSSVEVPLMELPSLGGVLTRAKTLALKKSAGDGSYIQLRSRRIVKPNSTKKQKESCVPRNPNGSTLKVEKLDDKEEENLNLEISDEESSNGENILETEGRRRGRVVMDYNEKLLLLIVMFLYIRYFWPRHNKRKRDNTSVMSGHHFTLELLQGNDTQCIELLRMSRDSFVRLCTHFRVKGWLQDSKNISLEEKMAMFFMMLGDDQRFSVVKCRFQHSKQTIYKYFHEVLSRMLDFAKEVIVPTSFNPNPNIQGHHKRLRQVFKGAIGALDGTLIHAIVPVEKQHLYRVRGKGDCYQNVLAICDFNMVFTFLVAGWEGEAHDSRILAESLTNDNAPFPLPPSDKYYLCDVAYAHTRGFMAPYRNVRYSLGDFRQNCALTDKEKFNHAHAQLRNVIERAYGVLKTRFPILKRMAPFSLLTQRNVTIECFALHNFIRKEGLSDEFFDEYDHANVHLQDGDEQVQDGGENREQEVARHGSSADDEFMSQLRDQIAQDLMQNNVL